MPRVFRLPDTRNYKLGVSNDAPICHIVEFNNLRFTPTEIDDKLNALIPFDGSGNILLNLSENIFKDVGADAVKNLSCYGATEISNATRLYKLSVPNHFTLTGDNLKIISGKLYGSGEIQFRLTAETLTGATFQLNSVKLGGTELTASGDTYTVNLSADSALTAESFIQVSGKYSNEIQNVSVAGTANADEISNNAINVTVDAGAGNDLITNRATNVTITSGDGADTIQVDVVNVAEFELTDFAQGDEIQLINDSGETVAASALSFDGAGNLIAETADKHSVAIKGVGKIAETLNDWSSDSEKSLTSYAPTTVAGASIDGGKIIFAADATGDALVTFSGIAENSALDAFDEEKMIYLRELGGETVTAFSNAGGYSFGIGATSGKFVGTAGSDTIIIYSSGVTIDGGGDDIFSVAADVSSFTIENFSAGDKIQIEGETITALETIDGGMVLTVGEKTVSVHGLEKSTDDLSWNVDSGVAVYGTHTLAGAYLDSGTGVITFRALTLDETPEIEIHGVSVAPSVENKNVALVAANFADDTLSVVSGKGYTFNVAADVTGKKIYGSSVGDNIFNSGSDVTIYGGVGSDTVSVAASVTAFTFADFAAGDEIQLAAAVDKLESVDGGIKVGNLTIGGISSVARVETGWSGYTFKRDTIAGAALGTKTIDGNEIPAITYNSASGSENLFTVSGLTSKEGISVDTNARTITLTAANVGKENLSVSNEAYTIVLADELKNVHKDAGWEKVDSKLVYTTASDSGGFNEEFKYVPELVAKSFALEGLSTETGVEISDDGKVILSAVALTNIFEVTLTSSDGYELVLAADVATPATKEAGWTYSDKVATYKDSSTSAGYKLADNKISYVSASGGDTLVTVTGVKSLDGVSLNGTVVTVSNVALNQGTVTISDGYTLKLADDVTAPVETKAGCSKLSSGKATYKFDSTTAGYSLANNKITYTKAVAAKSFSLSGIKSTSGIKVDGSTVTLNTSNLNKKTVTISDGFSLKLDDDVTAPTTLAPTWTVNDTNATLYSNTSAGYSL